MVNELHLYNLNSNLIIYDSFEKTIEVDANSDNSFTITDNYTIPDGYKIACCIPMLRSSNGVTAYATVKCVDYALNGIPNIIVNNSGPSSYTWTIECRLFLKK